ncbi:MULTISPECIES: 3-dehydroquinate synthase [Paenibacillus]|uniref:3-dehydroquinate synthase n=1 Tax=Paenibacillus borealis TaxID=160799 RepID=A0ABX3GTP3_PAEBO|nr:3-dehydroquinate synthase [Paenibacillus borealis]OMD36386.1 3-dehydroquinate synthase [Paenibacillus borealis]
MTNIRVNLKKIVDKSYNIEIGRDLIHLLVSDLQNELVPNIKKIAIITDSKVKEIYGMQFLEILRSNDFECDIFSIPNGEISKTRETKIALEDQLISKGYGRDSCIIALGGGMISDLAGFLAGTFCRGIPYLIYSTTLLSAADASIGGKTGVDTPFATNLIGMFHQPQKVYIDLNTWNTLSVREFRSGLAETIKHACMADEEFFYYLERNMNLILIEDNLLLDSSVCEHIARKNCEIKYRIVEKDEEENNLRQILNLGHTAGRALETLSNYELLHGEAVVIGLVVQIFLANQLGYLPIEDLRRVLNLLLKAGFSIQYPPEIEFKTLIEKMYTDKKVRSGEIRFVLMEKIGQMMRFGEDSYSRVVTESEILQALHKMKVEING